MAATDRPYFRESLEYVSPALIIYLLAGGQGTTFLLTGIQIVWPIRRFLGSTPGLKDSKEATVVLNF
jgi:hypothetical protein